MREESRLRVFENIVLREKFGSERGEVTGEWRRLHNEELYGLYCSSYIVRVIKSKGIKWAGHVARIGERKGALRVFGGETGRKKATWKNQV
jgi:hypothetical protein